MKSVHACKGYSSEMYPEQDQGLVLLYVKTDGSVFYRQYTLNTEIKTKLSIIHEATDGELVQYYVLPSSMTEEDKNTHAIGIYDEENKSWSYADYDEVPWNTPGQRIAGNRLERLGEKVH